MGDPGGVGQHLQMSHLHSPVDAQPQADVVTRPQPLPQQARGNARGVPDAGGVCAPASAPAPAQALPAAHIARPHHHGEDELIASPLGHQGLGVADDDLDLIARHDVGDGLGEDVWALLLQQGSGLAPGLGPPVDGARLGPPLHHALDHPLTHPNGQRVYGRPVGQGEDVDGLDGLSIRILKELCHLHPGHKAGHLGVHVRVLQGQGHHLASGGLGLHVAAVGYRGRHARGLSRAGVKRLPSSQDQRGTIK